MLETIEPRVLGDTVRDLTQFASLSASSWKHEFAVDRLLQEPDPALPGASFWQSDGNVPHHIYVQFQQRMSISLIAFCLNMEQDDSYTPRRIHVMAGTSHNDLRVVCAAQMEDPCGWTFVDLQQDGQPLQAHLLQISILENHQNGRDSRIHFLRVYGPRTDVLETYMPEHTSLELQMHAQIR